MGFMDQIFAKKENVEVKPEIQEKLANEAVQSSEAMNMSTPLTADIRSAVIKEINENKELLNKYNVWKTKGVDPKSGKLWTEIMIEEIAKGKEINKAVEGKTSFSTMG